MLTSIPAPACMRLDRRTGTAKYWRVNRSQRSLRVAAERLARSDRLWDHDPDKRAWCNLPWGETNNVSVICVRGGIGCNIDHLSIQAMYGIPVEPDEVSA